MANLQRILRFGSQFQKKSIHHRIHLLQMMQLYCLMEKIYQNGKLSGEVKKANGRLMMMVQLLLYLMELEGFKLENFGSVQLHLEWKTSEDLSHKLQDRSNSGVFLQNRYEIQILDSYDNPTYVNGQAGSVYKQHIPLVNASRKPGEWQSYDIIFEAPEFNDDGEKTKSGYFTVFHNGILIQNHVEILGTTENVGPPKNIAHGDAPISLQNHCCTQISFRNIWVRKL